MQVHAYLPWYISQAAIYGSSQDLLSSADQLKEELGGTVAKPVIKSHIVPQ